MNPVLQMTHSNNTFQITLGLANYLEENDFFDEEDEIVVNQKIIDLWDTKLKTAITTDIQSKFNNVDFDFIASKFELSSEDNQGACTFFHQVVITDSVTLESIKAFVKILVSYNKTSIYLDSSYATVGTWKGKSEQLKKIFTRLKTADKNFSYSNPISLTELIR